MNIFLIETFDYVIWLTGVCVCVCVYEAIYSRLATLFNRGSLEVDSPTHSFTTPNVVITMGHWKMSN